MEIQNIEPKKFVFKKYYESNPEFRERHIANMLERIDCPCGAKVMRSNITRHLKTNLHLRKLKGGECDNNFHKKQTVCDTCGGKYVDINAHCTTHRHKKALKELANDD